MTSHSLFWIKHGSHACPELGILIAPCYYRKNYFSLDLKTNRTGFYCNRKCWDGSCLKDRLQEVLSHLTPGPRTWDKCTKAFIVTLMSVTISTPQLIHMILARELYKITNNYFWSQRGITIHTSSAHLKPVAGCCILSKN